MEKIHNIENEVLNKKNELSELQKALSDSHLAVYDERMQFMKLKREYNLMRSNQFLSQYLQINKEMMKEGLKSFLK